MGKIKTSTYYTVEQKFNESFANKLDPKVLAIMENNPLNSNQNFYQETDCDDSPCGSSPAYTITIVTNEN